MNSAESRMLSGILVLPVIYFVTVGIRIKPFLSIPELCLFFLQCLADWILVHLILQNPLQKLNSANGHSGTRNQPVASVTNLCSSLLKKANLTNVKLFIYLTNQQCAI